MNRKDCNFKFREVYLMNKIKLYIVYEKWGSLVINFVFIIFFF